MISEEALKALEQTNPDLVARYRAKMASANDDVQDASDMQGYGSMANTAAKIATDYANSQKNDAILYNSFGNMGRAPTVSKAERVAYDPSAVNNATAQNLARAKDAQSTARENFMDEDRLANEVREHGRQDKADAWQGEQQDRQRKDWAGADAVAARKADPNSQESQMARATLRKMMPKANIPDTATAEQIEPTLSMAEKVYAVDSTERARADARNKPFEYTDKDGNKRLGQLRGNQLVQLDGDPIVTPKSGKMDFSQVPPENQEVIKELSKKDASKIGIANQIDSVMKSWDSLSEDQKVAQGRQLLKVLNSTEGADAVGAEEAKRLGSKLEFALGNFTNSNPTQFGRDLPGFKEQANNTSKAIRGAIKANEDEIQRRYGRTVPQPPGPPVRMKAPDGKVYNVPADKVDMAKQNGWVE